MRVVQISDGVKRRVALVAEPYLYCVRQYRSVYDLAAEAVERQQDLKSLIEDVGTNQRLNYDEIYKQSSEWTLMSPIDVPGRPEYLFVGGTGLTNLGSAQSREAMHSGFHAGLEEMTNDSIRMFASGVQGGKPPAGTIGVAPEWFYKGNGSVLKPPFGDLEAEVASIYYVGPDHVPYRIGFCAGNEFADHKFEQRNYLNLAGSKLRDCSIGPELLISADFSSVKGFVEILRNTRTIWHREIFTGEDHMSHSLANLEHHHFKFSAHRTPRYIHVHFLGAHSLSFSDKVQLEDGDRIRIAYENFGRPLCNRVRIEEKTANHLLTAVPL